MTAPTMMMTMTTAPLAKPRSLCHSKTTPKSSHGIRFPFQPSHIIPHKNPANAQQKEPLKNNPRIDLKITAPTMITIMIMMLTASLDKTSSLCHHRTSPTNPPPTTLPLV